MKKLGLKLGLSCAALAACATTLVSTTFAWYTSNTTVTATGLHAQTESANSDSLQISKDGTNWGSTVDLSTITSNLTPVERTAGSAGVASTFKIQNSNGTTNPVSETAANKSENFVQFDLYFRNITMPTAEEVTENNGEGHSSCPVYIKAATASNETSGGVDTKLVADFTSAYTQAAYENYKVDILRAMDLEIVASHAELDEDSEDSKILWSNMGDVTNDSINVYNLESFASADTFSAQSANNPDALAYYNAVKNLTGTDAATRPNGYAEPSTGLSTVVNTSNGQLGTITSNAAILKTTWTLYLDGWDTACYDACKGQNVTFSFTFVTAL